MTNDEEIEANVIKIFEAAKPKKTITKKPKLKDNPTVSQTVIGNKNILAGRDVIVTEKIAKK